MRLFERRGIFKNFGAIHALTYASRTLTLRDATEATHIGIGLTQPLRSGRAVDVE